MTQDRTILRWRGLFVGRVHVFGNSTPPNPHAYVVASYHPPTSYSWGWALYRYTSPEAKRWGASFRRSNGHGHADLSAPLIGGLSLRWQPLAGPTHIPRRRRRTRRVTFGLGRRWRVTVATRPKWSFRAERDRELRFFYLAGLSVTVADNGWNA